MLKKLIYCFILVWTSSSWADWPRLPYPKHAKVEAIGENIRLNGVPMRMHRVLSKESAESILDFYKGALGEEHAEMRQRKPYMEAGGQVKYLQSNILSQLKNDYLITVKVTALGPKLTEVLLAISDGRPTASTKGLPLGFVLPVDSELHSDMESLDGAKQSRQLIFSNAQSIETNKNHLVDMLSRKGYQLEHNFTKNTERSLNMLFQGDGRDAQIVITRFKGKTNVVMTTIESVLQ